MKYAGMPMGMWVLSAASALVALVPFVYIWKILRDVLNAAPDYAQAVNIPHYGWMAVLFAVLSFLIMATMTGKCMAEKMRQYGNALEAMSNEAVEYVRGIPVVKTFGQSVR